MKNRLSARRACDCYHNGGARRASIAVTALILLSACLLLLSCQTGALTRAAPPATVAYLSTALAEAQVAMSAGDHAAATAQAQGAATAQALAAALEAVQRAAAAQGTAAAQARQDLTEARITATAQAQAAALAQAQADGSLRAMMTALVQAQSTPTVTPTPNPTTSGTPSPEKAANAKGTFYFPAFNASRRTYDIYTVTLPGGQPQRLVEDASQPALSPDGRRLAYRRWEQAEPGIMVMDASGGDAVYYSKYLEDTLPAWSPNGVQVVFASRRERDREGRLYTVGVPSATEREIRREDEPTLGEYPAWLADGRVVYRVTAPQIGLAMINADGSGFRMLVADSSATAPAVANRGRQIAFMSHRDGNWELYRINADGSDLVRLTNNGANDGLPAWAPDGGLIAFVSDRGGNWAMYAMSPNNGGAQVRLFALPSSIDGQVGVAPGYMVRGWLEERIAWGN